MLRHAAPLIAAFAMMAAPASSHADQPHMHAALKALQDAKGELQKASGDKGGHRSSAGKLIDQAIDEVRAGIEYDRKNEAKGETKDSAKNAPKADKKAEPKK
jgi:hypothetical protein